MNDYEPLPIGARLRIAPPGAPASRDGRIDLVLARGAFGSGEHETTSSCLEALEQIDTLAGARVLDLGCGTGILTVAALALGAASARCIDVDPAAMACTRRNCELNDVQDRAELVLGSIAEAGHDVFDLLLANLHGDLLVRLGPEIVARARPGALVLLSGILWEHDYDVRRCFEGLGCELLGRRMLAEYCTMLWRRRAA